jgi:hypothetical protein
MTAFYLGTHHPSWLGHAGVALFVSHRRLAGRRRLPRATTRWALDSGGFTELSLHGRWQTTPVAYAEAVTRYMEEIGRLEWASPQDWMCEPIMLQRTGLSVLQHQHRTVANYLELRRLAPGLPFIPVLQGWRLDDYLACVDLYQQAGVDLARVPLIGLGSVCRRQATTEIARIVTELAGVGVRLHGFGVKRAGLAAYADGLASADSMAWSYHARRRPPLPDCVGHKNCANCLPYALAWRAQMLAILDQPRQGRLPLHHPAHVRDPLGGAA